MVNIRKKIKEQGFTLEQVAAKMRKARGNSKGEIGISQPALFSGTEYGTYVV